MKQVIDHYALNHITLNNGPYGTGIYLPKGLKKNAGLIKFDFNKIINNKRINFGLFF